MWNSSNWKTHVNMWIQSVIRPIIQRNTAHLNSICILHLKNANTWSSGFSENLLKFLHSNVPPGYVVWCGLLCIDNRSDHTYSNFLFWSHERRMNIFLTVSIPKPSCFLLHCVDIKLNLHVFCFPAFLNHKLSFPFYFLFSCLYKISSKFCRHVEFHSQIKHGDLLQQWRTSLFFLC